LTALVGPAFRGASPQREGWGRFARLFLAELVECLHSPFCGIEGVFVFRPRSRPRRIKFEDEDEDEDEDELNSTLVSQPKTVLRIFIRGTKLKDQCMKKINSLLALAGLFLVSKSSAISLDDVQLWTGSGTNRAALVIEWNSPEVFNATTIPAPVANKTLVWGYRFNGTPTGTQMLAAVLAADPKLYVVADETYGTFVESIGYNLNGNGVIGVTDGTGTNFITGGLLTNATVNVDAATPLNNDDLFWSGYFGPNWQVWTELGDSGGFTTSPNRGTNAYWNADTEDHGQWEFSYYGLDDLPLTNGSWIGFSVSAAGYPTDTNDPSYYTNLAVVNNDEQAPPSPDGTYTAYVCNTNDFAVQIVSTNNVYTVSPYNNPTAVLGRPTLKFIDHFTPHQTSIIHRSKIVEPPYWTDPNTNDVIAEISSGGQITVNMGRKIYDDPNNPYGVDLIVYGNSFFSASGYSGSEVNDFTDLGIAKLSSGIYGHSTTVSVSQDGTNWYAFNNIPLIYPDNAYRWDDTNHSWTDEQMNPTKPLNPYVNTNNFGGQSVASGLDQFIGAAGGTGFDLKASGLPWIQYVRVQPGVGTYTVIDAIVAVDPVVVGDTLSITPDNLASGTTNLVFQKPADSSRNLITINFDSVSAIAKVSTVGLSEFSAFAPVIGIVSSAYQITLKPVSGTNAVNYVAGIGLRASDNYTGGGGDLRVYQWNRTNWTSQPFTFNSADNEVLVAGVTNFSAFVVSQIIPPQLNIQTITNGFAFQFTPLANCAHILERSADLVTWTPIFTNTPASTQPITLQDTNAPTGKAFYRVLLNP